MRDGERATGPGGALVSARRKEFGDERMHARPRLLPVILDKAIVVVLIFIFCTIPLVLVSTAPDLLALHSLTR